MYAITRINPGRVCTIDMYRSLAAAGGFGLRQERPRLSVDEQRNPGNNVCQSFRREGDRTMCRSSDKPANVSLQISIAARKDET